MARRGRESQKNGKEISIRLGKARKARIGGKIGQ